MRVSLQRLASTGWLRACGAILFLVLATTSCGPAATTPPVLPASAGAGSPGGAPQATPLGAASAAPADLLAAALKPLLVAAAFETRVEIDGSLVLSATGRSVGPASTSGVTTAGRTIDYVQVPPHAWARDPGGSWLLVGSDAAPAAPLEVLSKPLTLAPAQAGTGRTSLDATYPAAALGLTGDPVAVTITLDAAGVTFSYQATQSGHKTISTTTLRPGSADPIVPPAP